MLFCSRFPVVLFLVALFCSSAAAQSVYRCQEKGQAVYSQFPCTQGSSSRQLEIKSADIADSQIDSKLVWKTYDVKGTSYSALVISLNLEGPKVNNKSFHGLARWNVSYTYKTKAAGKKCRFETVQLKIEGEILMPRWIDEAQAPPDLRQRWNTYHAALKNHEEGHIQHGRELAQLIRERFLGLGDMECDDVSRSAQTEFNRIYNNMKSRDRDYDQRTQHGATQGALI